MAAWLCLNQWSGALNQKSHSPRALSNSCLAEPCGPDQRQQCNYRGVTEAPAPGAYLREAQKEQLCIAGLTATGSPTAAATPVTATISSAEKPSYAFDQEGGPAGGGSREPEALTLVIHAVLLPTLPSCPVLPCTVCLFWLQESTLLGTRVHVTPCLTQRPR